MSTRFKVILALLLLGLAGWQILQMRPLVFSELTDDSPVDTTDTEITLTTHPDGRQVELLSAFFGLDNTLPSALNGFVHKEAGGKDGMPVVFSHEIDAATMQAGDFRVTMASGKIGALTCVTLAPADDLGELRTALLVGEYGSLTDPPVKVEVVGNLLSKDRKVNFRGKAVPVIPLEAGPSIVLAQIVPPDEWETGKRASRLPLGGGSGCPPGTKQVVRVTWEGGVTKPGGEEVDDKERLLYKVMVESLEGTVVSVTPFAIADMGDADNNHRLCLD
ncbi:MAG: hypothetical protein AAGB46_17890, partial [Verrucomicrobiota bacterium]